MLIALSAPLTDSVKRRMAALGNLWHGQTEQSARCAMGATHSIGVITW